MKHSHSFLKYYMKLRQAIKFPTPLQVVIKFPVPGKTKMIKFFPEQEKESNGGGGGGGGEMLKLHFDWYIIFAPNCNSQAEFFKQLM